MRLEFKSGIQIKYSKYPPLLFYTMMSLYSVLFHRDVQSIHFMKGIRGKGYGRKGYVVQRHSKNIHKNCAFCDGSAKRGGVIKCYMGNIFRCETTFALTPKCPPYWI